MAYDCAKLIYSRLFRDYRLLWSVAIETSINDARWDGANIKYKLIK